MHTEFWQQRWRDQQTGFHCDNINVYLRMYWSMLSVPRGARVLVPLCGKSRDLLWLAQQGYHVIGVELSPLAVQAFFAEQQLLAQPHSSGATTCYSTDHIDIWCEDIFSLSSAQLGRIDAVYDRAALIALPETMRAAYVKHLGQLIGPAVPQLVVTLDYAQAYMAGPPFAVSPQEMTRLYGGRYATIRPLVCYDVLPEHERFAAKGIPRLVECVYLLKT